MEKTVFVEPLQKRFKVEVWESHKSARNKSYLNASDCCGVKLEQEKHCSECKAGEGVAFTSGGKTQRKIVKISKKEYLFPVDAVDAALEQMEEQEEIVISKETKQLPTDFMERVDSVMYAGPAKKAEKHYAEMQEFLKGKHLVGKMVLRGNDMEVTMFTGSDGVIRIAKMVEQRNMNEKPNMEEMQGVAANPQVIEIERTILEKQAVEMYDFKQFQDARSQVIEQIIEDVVLNGKVPEVQAKPNVVQQQEENELERLKRLAGA